MKTVNKSNYDTSSTSTLVHIGIFFGIMGLVAFGLIAIFE